MGTKEVVNKCSANKARQGAVGREELEMRSISNLCREEEWVAQQVKWCMRVLPADPTHIGTMCPRASIPKPVVVGAGRREAKQTLSHSIHPPVLP